jgi:acylglycerol lipase
LDYSKTTAPQFNMSNPINNSIDDEGADIFVSIRGTKCFVHHWNVHPPNNTTGSEQQSQSPPPPKALIVLFHGFLAHGNYPTVRYAAEFLSTAGYAVVSVDFPGHGRSEGIRGYLKSADDLIEDGIAMVEYAQSLYTSKTTSENHDDVPQPPPPQLVLCGSSMGGAIALSVAHKLRTPTTKLSTTAATTTTTGIDTDDGIPPSPLVILLAPMLQLNVSSLERTALQCLAFVAPTAQLIPSSSTDPAKQYRDPSKRQECKDDILTVSGSKLCVASALTCVDITWKIHNNDFGRHIDTPFLLLIADDDVVVKNSGSEDFFANCSSVDKTKKNYPALHGLLCEPPPLFDEIRQDILNWLNQRT